MEEVEKRIIGLFEQIAEREQEIKDIREEIKDSMEQFCDEFDQFEKKSVKDGYKFFKQLAKDKSSTVDAEFQRDKIVELLIGGSVETV